MHLEEFTLSGSTRMSGHSHTVLHLCLVESGGFEERHSDSWFACSSGTIRVSAAGTRHNIQVQSTGAAGRVVELMPSAQSGLASELHGSVLLDWEAHQDTVQRLIHSWDSGERFHAECASLELAATALSPHAAAPPAWLNELRA